MTANVQEQERRPFQLRLPINVLLILAALVCVCASFAGGFILYMEVLRVIEDTVKEVSAADTALSVQILGQSFTDLYWAERTYEELLPQWLRTGPYDSIVSIQPYFMRDQWAKCSTSESLYGAGLVIGRVHSPETTPTGLYQILWWDPLTDPDTIAKNNNSTQQWVSGEYIPEYWGHPSCKPEPDPDKPGADPYPDSLKKCVYTRQLDPKTGNYQRFVYNFSDSLVNKVSNEWQEQQEGWETAGAKWWRPPSVWYSEDDTPYLYGTYMSVYPRMDGVPYLRGFKFTIAVYVTFYNWQDKLAGQGSEAIVIASFLDAGIDSQVVATNSGEALMKPGCRGSRTGATVTGRHPCIVTYHDLSPTIRDARVILEPAETGAFLREDISGGTHWLRRRLIFEPPNSKDQMAHIHLLWIRPTSSVQDKTDRGLHYFIGFLCGLFLFQVIVLCLLVLKIGRPMGEVASAMQLLDTLELDKAEDRALGIGEGCFVIAEIATVVNSFLCAIQALRVYKAYLPQSVVEDEDEAAEEQPGADIMAPHIVSGSDSVCIVFTDIQSSTQLWEECPQSMRDALMLHNAALRQVAARHGGYEVKVIGDAFMLAFPSAKDGAAFALEAQQALVAQDWPAELLECDLCRRIPGPAGSLLWAGLRVRIGCNYGQVFPEQNPISQRWDYFGPPVNVAARVEAALVHGGLIGVTDAVLAAIGPEGLQELGKPVMIPMGALELKGVKEAVSVDVMLPPALAERRERIGKKKNEDIGFPAEPTVGTTTGFPDRQISVQPSRRYSVQHSVRTRDGAATGKASAGSADPAADTAAGAKAALGMTPATITVACVRCSLPKSTLGVPAAQRLSVVLASLEYTAQRSRGVISYVTACSAVVTWNATTPCPPHAANAARFISAAARPRDSADVHIGARSGSALVGNIAAGRRRHSSIIGGCVELANMLSQEADLWGDSALVDTAVAEQCGTASVVRAQVWSRGAYAGQGDIVVWEYIVAGDTLLDFSGDGSTPPDAERVCPLQLLIAAATGDSAAVQKLEEVAAEADGDPRSAALLARLRAGSVCFRRAPPSAFHLDAP
eukprot:TRINITY_DN4693_c0_g5_i1.p1 TRINITY_DN4693_c0_g5~~TRINITY_DN4693_c0_g5_i1.p1  ORF type:complete len:1099 (+),score=316.60 TRINITY_DN4693_c0_g5_i1:90-3299(+)